MPGALIANELLRNRNAGVYAESFHSQAHLNTIVGEAQQIVDRAAQSGSWVAGPGIDLFEAIKRELGALPFIAEDRGVITPDVVALRDACRLPGARVLQFAFNGDSANPDLPHMYLHNLVAYTATHDNNTTRGWFESLSVSQQQIVWQYVGRSPDGSHGKATGAGGALNTC